MPQVSDTQLKEMVQAIENPGLRKQFEMIVTGKIISQVRCLSRKCKGRVIGVKYTDGQWVTSPNAIKKSGLVSHRERFDGNTGFACRCGNRSIVAAQEEGVIGGNVPSRKDLAKIYNKVQKSPTKKTEALDGSVTVDGFQIEPVKGNN